MARILFTTKNMAGLLNPALELARRLRVDGHDIAFIGEPAAAAAVTADGFRHIAIRDDLDAIERMEELGGAPLPTRLRSGWSERRRLDQLVEPLRAIADEAPDLIVHDIEMHALIIATSQLPIPAMILTPWCTVYRDSAVAPMHTALDHSNGRLGLDARRAWAQLVAARLWEHEVVKRLSPRRILERYTAPFRYHIIERRTLARIARRHQFSLRQNASQTNWLLPHIYTHLPVVTSVLQEFDLAQRTPHNFTYLGSMVRPEPTFPAMSDLDHERTNAAFAAAREPGRHLVYFSVGTRSVDVVPIATKVADAYADDPDAVLLISVGNRRALRRFGDHHASNVFVVGYAPQFDVLKEAGVTIIHGGINTIAECIERRVPMLVHTFGTGDQPGCALRVHHHGLGRRLDLVTASGEQIRSTAESLRNDREVGRTLDAFAAHAQRYRDDRVAERYVEGLLNGR